MQPRYTFSDELVFVVCQLTTFPVQYFNSIPTKSHPQNGSPHPTTYPTYHSSKFSTTIKAKQTLPRLPAKDIMSYYFSKARQLISFAPTAPDAPTEAHPSKSIPTSTSSSSFPSNGRYGHDRYSLHPDTVVGRETYKKYATHAYDTALNRGIGGKGESVKGRGFCLLGMWFSSIGLYIY